MIGEDPADGSTSAEDAWVEPHVVADPSRAEWARPGRGGEEDDEDEELQLGGGRHLMGGDGATDQGEILAGLDIHWGRVRLRVRVSMGGG